MNHGRSQSSLNVRRRLAPAHKREWNRLIGDLSKPNLIASLDRAARRFAEGRRAYRPRWADHRKVPQIAFKPDWTKHAKAAPFKRNDQMLDVLPIGVFVLPGSGIQENLADTSASPSGNSAMVARKRNPPISHTIYALLACAAITVAPFVNGCRPCRLAKKAEIGWQTARLCSKVHRIDRPDRQSRRRSKEEIEHVERR